MCRIVHTTALQLFFTCAVLALMLFLFLSFVVLVSLVFVTFAVHIHIWMMCVKPAERATEEERGAYEADPPHG